VGSLVALHIYRICTSCSEREANVYADVHNICLTYTHTCTCMALSNTCECMHTHRKNAYGLVHARLCNGAAASLPWKLLRTYLESCASIVQAVLCRPPSCRPSPDAVRCPVARRSSLKKSVQIHASSSRGRRCGVAQASSDHLRWCRPHPVCFWVALALGR